jgi:ABC-type transport system substrate-binding protein
MLEVIRQLKEAGFNVEVAFKESGKDFAGAIEAGEYDIISSSSLSTINDLTDVAADMGGSSSYTPMYFDPKVDSMVNDANATFDPAARLAKLQEISKFFADEHGVIPVRVSTYPNYVRNTIVTGNMDLLTQSNPYYLYKLYSK